MSPAVIRKIFLHGLDSSSQGTKGRFFQEHFTDFCCPDFSGNLDERLGQLEKICTLPGKVLLVGSSFGGLMATCYAIAHPDKVSGLILLAPALNFADYAPPPQAVTPPTLLIIGRQDQVTPARLVVTLAEQTFTNLKVILVDDDHLLRSSFPQFDWPKLCAEQLTYF